MSSVRGKGLIIRKRVIPKINAKKTELISSSENDTSSDQQSKLSDKKVSTDGNNSSISNSRDTVNKTYVPPAVTSLGNVETVGSDKSVKANSPETLKNDINCSIANESVDKLSNCNSCEELDVANLGQSCNKPPVITNIPCGPTSDCNIDKKLVPPLTLAKLKKRAAPVVPKKRNTPDVLTRPVEVSSSVEPIQNADQTDPQDNASQIKENDRRANNNLIVQEVTEKDSEELKPQITSDVNHADVNEKLPETTIQNPVLNSSNDKLLKKRAAPILPKKRPLPNVSNLSKEIPKDCSKSIDNKNNDKKDNKKIDQNESLSLPFSEPTSLNLETLLDSKNISPSHPVLPKQETPLVCSEPTVNKNDETVRQYVPNIEDRNVDVTSSIKEVQHKVTSNKMIKRRLGPKIVNKKAGSGPKGNEKTTDDPNPRDLKPQSPMVQSNSIQLDDIHLTESASLKTSSLLCNDELKDDCVNPSQICNDNETKVTIDCNNSRSVSEPSSLPVVEGVVRIYLNCWPQYPLDDLKEDPFFEDRNIQDLGKISIFRSKDKNIAYCDMVSNVDFQNIPKNWAYVNFNKLIKEEFKDKEYEEVENPITEDFSETNDSFNNQYENETQTFDQSNSPGILNEDEQLANTSEELSTEDYQMNQFNEDIKKDDRSTDIEDKSMAEEGYDKDVTEPVESVTKNPYKLRKSKPLAIVNYDGTEVDDVLSEDIFSNSAKSSDSEYDGENKIKGKWEPKKRKRRSKKVSNKKDKKPSVKDSTEEVNSEKKERVKSSKPKKLSENASPFMKLENQVKNKKKWDDDGNCAEPEKLELKDFIFYVPKSVPMSQEAKERKTSLTNEETNETTEVTPKEEEEEENHGPKLIVKDGKIIVDPNSTKIKRTPIIHFKSEKWEKPREINDPWEVRETMKFYANLWKYGIDYSVLAASFPKKSRDALKKKFSYEERYNGSLLGKTLTKKLPLESVLREVVLIDSLEKLNCKRKANNQKVTKENSKKEKKQPKHCLLKKRRTKSNNNQDSKKIRLENSQFSEIEDDDSIDWSKENDKAISKESNPINMQDVITFSTNVIYKDMNIVESVSFHPSAIQPVDINVTISHEPKPIASPQDTAIK